MSTYALHVPKVRQRLFIASAKVPPLGCGFLVVICYLPRNPLPSLFFHVLDARLEKSLQSYRVTIEHFHILSLHQGIVLV